jgi:Holliday junction resolvasome RuvABC endonuclease subunit
MEATEMDIENTATKPTYGYYGSDFLIAGLDLSIRGTAIFIVDSAGTQVHRTEIKIKQNKGEERVEFTRRRIITIRDTVIETMKLFKVTKIAVEGFSFGSRGQSLADIFGLNWVVRIALFENSYNYVDVSPKSLKAFVTGSGNADKAAMMQAIEYKYGMPFESDNEADAYGLCRFYLALGDDAESIAAKGGADKIRRLRATKGDLL